MDNINDDNINRNNMNIEKIKEIVDEYSGLDISSKTKTDNYVWLRWIYFRMCKNYSKKSNVEISKLVNKDHASVYHGFKKYESELLNNKVFLSWHNDIHSIVCRDISFSFKKVESLQDLDIMHKVIIHNKDQEIKDLKDKLSKKIKKNPIAGKILSIPSDTLEELYNDRIIPFLKMKESQSRAIGN